MRVRVAKVDGAADRGFDPNVGLAALSGVVLVLMATLIVVALAVAEPERAEPSGADQGSSTLFAWQDPPQR